MSNQADKKKTSIQERRRNRRAVLMGVFFSICLVGLLYRIWYWQTVHGDHFERRAIAQQSLAQIVTGPQIAPGRGQITDRNFMPIALSHPVYEIFVDVRLAVERPNPHTVSDIVAALHEALDIPRHELEAIFARDAQGNLINDTFDHTVAWNIPSEIAHPLRSNSSLRDVHIRQHTQRLYDDPFFAPHVIGFRWGDDFHGLEHMYNAELTGSPGRVFRTIDNQGNQRVETESVRHGLTVITTLDSDIQRLSQAIVDNTYRNIPSRRVGLLVMDPHSGEILAMAQAPTFSIAEPNNPEYFTDLHLRNNWDNLSSEDRLYGLLNTWSNFHVVHSYEPGSIFKPFVMAAALEEGVISIHDTFFCGGYINVSDRTVPCWFAPGHGSLTISEAMYRSCNVAMVEINNRLGRDAFYRFRGYFGFGERTGIDLPGEAEVSSPAVMYARHQLNPVEMATSSIGQGFNATTIQSITAFASLINGGNLMQPFLVSQIVDSYGNVVYENLPRVVRRTVSACTADFMRRDMQQVVTAEGGTGRTSAIPGHAIGGKTGTAQQGRGYNQTGISLTYIAYTPVENPEFIVLMVIDHVENEDLSSGTTVAPIVREFFEELIQIRNLPPSDGPHAYAHIDNRPASELMPDFSGQRLLDVVRNLNNRDLDFTIVGTGTVVSHHIPPPDRIMPKNVPVILYLDSSTRNEENMVIMPDVEGLPIAQAELIILEAQLEAVLVTNRRTDESSGDYTPGTAYAEVRIPTSGPPPYIIYRQFPQPGTEVERGLQVRLIAGR